VKEQPSPLTVLWLGPAAAIRSGAVLCSSQRVARVPPLPRLEANFEITTSFELTCAQLGESLSSRDLVRTASSTCSSVGFRTAPRR
jgi:hypothetical protein